MTMNARHFPSLHTSMVLFLLLAWTSVSAQSINDRESRQQFLLNDGWEYLEEDLPDVQMLMEPNRTWKPVTLPHTWNAFDVVDQIPGYRRAGSWYRRELFIAPSQKDLRYILSFEGVNITCEVYVNGSRAGGHVGGYIGFDVDITELVRKGVKNILSIRADNSVDRNVIPSHKSDFHIYGGITRDVWLVVVPSRHIELAKISTPIVTKRSASTRIEVRLQNHRSELQQVEVVATLNDRTGKKVESKAERVQLKPGRTVVELRLPEVKNPNLWSPSNPYLYTMHVAVKERGGAIDEIAERVGFRWFEFEPRGPFFLNGERLLLRGTHRHEDHAGVGNAMPDSLHRNDMVMIKEMGANFVRLAHYPQDPEIYRACDELGLLVWDELPWCRGGMGGEEWKQNTERLFREQIDRIYNHPSVIIRSLGNEIFWLPDFPGGDHTDSLRMMLKRLNDIARELDPYRLTTTRKYDVGSDLVDIFSPSMWPGWYSGVYHDFEKTTKANQEKFPRFFHPEYGGDSHVGRHTENPVTGDGMLVPDAWDKDLQPVKLRNVSESSDWGENYIVDLSDWYLHISERSEWLTGNAQWAFKDFPTPLRPENPIPYVNQKGLVDRAGNPKDAYYVFKSYWTTSPKFCYIESPTWTERSGPKNHKRPVNVFSNCEEVELFLNGESQGVNTRDIGTYPSAGLHWQVRFREGENRIAAVGISGKKRVTVDSLTVTYSFKRNQKADDIDLTYEYLPSGNILITAVARDKDGRRALDYNKRIYFTAEGAGRLVEKMGTPRGSSVIEMASGKAMIEFIPPASGKTIIEARNQDFKGSYLVFLGSRISTR